MSLVLTRFCGSGITSYRVCLLAFRITEGSSVEKDKMFEGTLRFFAFFFFIGRLRNTEVTAFTPCLIPAVGKEICVY